MNPYVGLLRENVNYRRLWLAQIVSNFGDWFGLLAIYAIVQAYSDSELLLGLVIVVKMLSLAVSSPIAGYLTDRYDRRVLMILCDGVRALLVLGLLAVRSEELLWLAYLLTAVQMFFSAIFEPAKTSSIPNVTNAEELVTANIISAASWSVIFTTGMAIGGVATAWLGTDLVFLLNAVSYVVSGVFIWRAVIPQQKMEVRGEDGQRKHPLQGIGEGFSYLFRNKEVLRPTLAKASFSSCLGALVYMLILLSEEVLLMGSIGLGFLYAARGIGTGIGPVIGRRMIQDERKWIFSIGFFMMFSGLMYLFVGLSEPFWMMLLFVMLAHATSGSNWVMSTVLLQRRAEDTFRGRVFSTEWLLFTLVQSFSVMLASLLLEWNILTLKEAMGVFSIGLMGIGVIWMAIVVPRERSYHRMAEDIASK
ncbi:MAG: MFS transporter [Bacteroidetes bacterium]|jgi:MFS family permease|nr:MAG: MFS transporter [Bacteroidota bacterium]